MAVQKFQILSSISSVSITQSINNGSTYNGSVTLPKACLITSITASQTSWVKLYQNASSQSSDASRSITTSPTSGSGLIMEINGTSITLSPVPIAINQESPTTTTYPITVTNNGTSGNVTININYIQL